jgi:molecular chaperone DnaK (HSP70)
MIRNICKKTISVAFSTKKGDTIIGIDLGTTNSCVAMM